MSKFPHCSCRLLQVFLGQLQAFDEITAEKNTFTSKPSPRNANLLLHQDQDASETETVGPVKIPTKQQMEPEQRDI